jgi:FSR family fosmidomycin resistance protein-like MFS transporter
MRAHSPRLAVLFTNVGHLLTHLLMLLYPTVVLSLEGKFGLSYGDLLELSLPGFVLYGAAALPAGWLGDRWSAEHMMVLFFIGSGVGCLATGLATGPQGIAVGLGLIGAFGSIYHPVGLAWLVRNAAQRGRVLAVNGIYGSIGIGSASFLAAALTWLAGWRAAFLVPGVVCLAVGIGLWFCLGSGRVVAGRSDLRPQPEPQRGQVVRAFVLLSVTMLGAGLVWQAMIVAMPKLFELRLAEITHGTTLGTGGLVSLVFVFSAATQIVGGWLADRYPLKWVYLGAWLAQVPVLLFLATAAGIPVFLASALSFCLMVISNPAENSLLVHYTPGKWRATAFGAKFVLSLGVSALGVPLVALIYDRTGEFVWLFGVLGGLAAIVVAAAWFLPRENRAVAVPTLSLAAE